MPRTPSDVRLRSRRAATPPWRRNIATPADAHDKPIDQRFLARAWSRTAAVRAGIISGAIVGAAIGGVGGRIVMRIVYLIDQSSDGAKTDFATVGEITLGGTFSLMMLSTIAGIIGGFLYIALRRWLPLSGVPRGVFFGLLMAFGPGVIALGEVDLQIFEPAVPVYWMFVALIVLYGVGVVMLTDRIHPTPATLRARRTELLVRTAQCVAAAGICAIAILTTQNVYDKAGSCLSADQNGGCAARSPD